MKFKDFYKEEKKKNPKVKKDSSKDQIKSITATLDNLKNSQMEFNQTDVKGI